MSGELLTIKQLDIVRFCAEECDRQRSGELSVGWMIQAWMHAIMTDTYLWLELGFVKELGRLVEPEENKNGFRRHGVAISNGFLDYTPIGSHWANPSSKPTSWPPRANWARSWSTPAVDRAE